MQQIGRTATSLKQRGDQYTQAATSCEPEADFLMQLFFTKCRHLMMHAIVKMILEHDNYAKLSKKKKRGPPCSSFQPDAGVGRVFKGAARTRRDAGGGKG